MVPIGLSLIPGVGPAVAAGYEAGKTYTHGGSLGDSLKSGGLSYAGNVIGGKIGNLLGDSLGTVGGTLGQGTPGAYGPAYNSFAGNTLGAQAGSATGEFVGNALGDAAGKSLSSVIGSYAGSNIAKNAFGDPQDTSLATAAPTPFSPTQQDAKDVPASIQGLGSLTSDQQSTNLATQGVYGGGNGSGESDYFLNLINRRLVDQSGHTSGLDTLKPIESSYLQKLGLGGYDNTNNLLEAISKWHAA